MQRALAEAVALRKPVYAFPVQNLDTLQSVDKYKGETVAVLRDAVCLKPVTTCEELYTAMLHYPIELCAGDFIRAEVRTYVHHRAFACKLRPFAGTDCVCVRCGKMCELNIKTGNIIMNMTC